MELEQRIKEIMADVLTIKSSEINGDTSMQSLSQWDSFAHITLIFALEEEFGVSFEVQDFELMTDFSAVLETLEKKIS